MRRLLSIATFVLAMALVPALAQRGGGHGVSAGGHGGFAGHGGGFGGHVGGGAGFGGMRGGGGVHSPGFRGSGFRNPGFHGSGFHQPRFHNPGFRNPGIAGRGFNRRPLLHQPTFRTDRFGGNRFRDDHFRDGRFRSFGLRNCFGFNCAGRGWPWWFAGYDPWLDSWWWDSGSSYDEDRTREIQAANEMNQQNLEEQGARHEEDQDLYARSDPAAPQRDAERADDPTPATVLVFRDQHRQEVQNYAIVGQMLWSFGGSRTQKIPLADLDIAATSKANDERGVDFHLPGTGEGQ
jgi:hypothetical protein